MVTCPECGECIAVPRDETPTTVIVTHLSREHGWFVEADGGHRVAG